MIVWRAVRRILFFATCHLIAAVALFIAALYVTGRELQHAEVSWWSDSLFWVSVVLLEPARSLLEYISPPRPLPELIFLVNSLAWGYAAAALSSAWRKYRGDTPPALPRFASFWLAVFAPMWAASGLYLFLTRGLRLMRGSDTPGEIGVCLLGGALAISVLGLVRGHRWAHVALITHWSFVAAAALALLLLRGAIPSAVIGAGAALTFVGLLATYRGNICRRRSAA